MKDLVSSNGSHETTSSPFVVGTMIKDSSKFYGRHKEYDQICDRLRKAESTSIVGPRRIGKSSMAYHVFSTAAAKLKAPCDFVWIDGQSSHAATLAAFCATIYKALSVTCVSPSTITDCLMSLETIVQAHGRRIAIFINEFEAFTRKERIPDFGIDFYNTLRYLADQGYCALITTSYTPLKSVCRDILSVSSPFYNVFEEISLGHFSDDEAHQFLSGSHDGFILNKNEVALIKTQVKWYQHPLVIQIAAETLLSNRDTKQPSDVVLQKIKTRVRNYLTHNEVRKGRVMKEQAAQQKPTLTKPIDITVSILIPVLGLGIMMLEYGLLIQWLSNFKAVLLAVATALVGFGILLFAGRSVDIISESTFFKLFASLISKLPLLSTLANMKKGPDVDSQE